jgi:hypothetical protein
MGLAFGAKFRHTWRSWLTLSVLIVLVSGFVLAAVTAARRTDRALSRIASGHGYDTVIYRISPLPQLARLPEVTRVRRARTPAREPDRHAAESERSQRLTGRRLIRKSRALGHIETRYTSQLLAGGTAGVGSSRTGGRSHAE